MKQLTKVDNVVFNEYYKGVSKSGYDVTCILDDYCVRYTVCKPDGFRSKRIVRREYTNENKNLCLKNATMALEM